MEIEQIEIFDFLAKTPPIDRINDNETIRNIALSIEIIYLRKGNKFLKNGDLNDTLYLIRTGAIELFNPDGSFYSRFNEGDWIGQGSLLSKDKKTTHDSYVAEDSLVYCINGKLFLDIYAKYPSLHDFFDYDKRIRLRNATQSLNTKTDNDLIFAEVKDLISSELLITTKKPSIVEVAKEMKAKKLNSMLVTEDGELCGIVTDRAFCDMAVANQMDLSQSIATIMTKNPITIDAGTMGSKALLIMAKHNIRHLPVTKFGQVIGIVTLTDLIRRQAHNAIYLVKEINSARSVDKLIKLGKQTPETLSRLVRNGHNPNDVVAMMSSITDNIAIQLLNFAEKKFGPPPVDYLFLVAGSQGREEQASNSDQDNVMILSDDYDEKKHGDYFINVARFVNDSLNDCGYVYCPGNTMAINNQWRQPYRVWKGYFNQWVNSPKPKALMYASTFFDMRPIHGNFALFEQLQTYVLNLVQKNQIFLGYLAANALSFKPPIGVFNTFILSGKGKQKNSFNMKKRGLLPIIDLVRIYALSEGITEVNTVKRILEAEKKTNRKSIYSSEGIRNLLDAYNFLNLLRLRHQASQIDRHQEVDNFISPKNLSGLERGYLKSAFEVVRIMQESLENQFRASQFR